MSVRGKKDLALEMEKRLFPPSPHLALLPELHGRLVLAVVLRFSAPGRRCLDIESGQHGHEGLPARAVVVIAVQGQRGHGGGWGHRLDVDTR